MQKALCKSTTKGGLRVCDPLCILPLFHIFFIKNAVIASVTQWSEAICPIAADFL